MIAISFQNTGFGERNSSIAGTVPFALSYYGAQILNAISHFKNLRQVEIGIGKAGIKDNGLSIAGDGFVPPLGLFKGDAQIKIYPCVIGADREGLLIGGNGLVRFSYIDQCRTKIVLHFQQMGKDFRRFSEMGHRMSQISTVL
jgi:hypothetical protein